MSILIEQLPGLDQQPSGPVEHVELAWHDRVRPRRKCTTTAGTEISLALPRGSVLTDGMLIYDSVERSIIVRAQREDLLVVEPVDGRQACAFAHHVGNWHHSLQFCSSGVLAAEYDQPLEDWLKRNRFKYWREERPYQPDFRGDSHD